MQHFRTQRPREVTGRLVRQGWESTSPGEPRRQGFRPSLQTGLPGGRHSRHRRAADGFAPRRRTQSRRRPAWCPPAGATRLPSRSINASRRTRPGTGPPGALRDGLERHAQLGGVPLCGPGPDHCRHPHRDGRPAPRFGPTFTLTSAHPVLALPEERLPRPDRSCPQPCTPIISTIRPP